MKNTVCLKCNNEYGLKWRMGAKRRAYLGRQEVEKHYEVRCFTSYIGLPQVM